MLPRIAVNAQINPDKPGGVETNICSLLEYLSANPDGLSPVVLALDEFEDSLRGHTGAKIEVAAWPHGQIIAPRTSFQPAVRGAALRRRLGRHAPLFDGAVKAYRKLRYGQPKIPSAQTVDRRLKQLGVGAVHFPFPDFFNTELPFLYEPWDLQHRHFPDFFTPEELAWREATYRTGCERARLVITATRWVKQDIVEQYGIPPEKIAAVPRGSRLGTARLDDNQRRRLLSDAGVPEWFMFYPAMTFEHKNHARLFHAMALLRDRHGIRTNLVMSGRRYGPFWPTLEAEIERLRLAGQITVLGGVSEELLEALFTAARLMVFPSLFEGLGLPILEAFQHGLPVLAAAETCIPEVVGDAAILFDGKDVESIASAIAHALDSPEELGRLVEAGYRRLSEFNWDQAGPKFVACYKHALDAPMTDVERQLFNQAIA